MPKEYISREAAIEMFEQAFDNNWEVSGTLDRIRAIPAADVVEVVRCQDCVHWRGENDICKGIGVDFSADGYCSEGKRKDGGHDD